MGTPFPYPSLYSSFVFFRFLLCFFHLLVRGEREREGEGEGKGERRKRGETEMDIEDRSRKGSISLLL
jgi:hypothetical protein